MDEREERRPLIHVSTGCDDVIVVDENAAAQPLLAAGAACELFTLTGHENDELLGANSDAPATRRDGERVDASGPG